MSVRSGGENAGANGKGVRDRVAGSEPFGVSPTRATERPTGWAITGKSDPATPHFGRSDASGPQVQSERTGASDG